MQLYMRASHTGFHLQKLESAWESVDRSDLYCIRSIGRRAVCFWARELSAAAKSDTSWFKPLARNEKKTLTFDLLDKYCRIGNTLASHKMCILSVPPLTNNNSTGRQSDCDQLKSMQSIECPVKWKNLLHFISMLINWKSENYQAERGRLYTNKTTKPMWFLV